MLTDWTLPHDLARTGLEAAAALVASYIEPGSWLVTLVVMGCGYGYVVVWGLAVQWMFPESAEVLDSAFDVRAEVVRLHNEETLVEVELRRAA